MPEFGPPVRPQLRAHAPFHEGPAHGRRIGLKLDQFAHVFLGQGVGDGGHNLGHLHQRAFEPTQRRLQFGGVVLAVEAQAENSAAGVVGGEPAGGGADVGIAFDPSAETVAILGAGRHTPSVTPV